MTENRYSESIRKRLAQSLISMVSGSNETIKEASYPFSNVTFSDAFAKSMYKTLENPEEVYIALAQVCGDDEKISPVTFMMRACAIDKREVIMEYRRLAEILKLPEGSDERILTADQIVYVLNEIRKDALRNIRNSTNPRNFYLMSFKGCHNHGLESYYGGDCPIKQNEDELNDLIGKYNSNVKNFSI